MSFFHSAQSSRESTLHRHRQSWTRSDNAMRPRTQASQAERPSQDAQAPITSQQPFEDQRNATRGVMWPRESLLSNASNMRSSKYASIQVILDPSLFDEDEFDYFPPPNRPLPPKPADNVFDFALSPSKYVPSRPNSMDRHRHSKNKSMVDASNLFVSQESERSRSAQVYFAPISAASEPKEPRGTPIMQDVDSATNRQAPTNNARVKHNISQKQSLPGIRRISGMSNHTRVQEIVKEKRIVLDVPPRKPKPSISSPKRLSRFQKSPNEPYRNELDQNLPQRPNLVSIGDSMESIKEITPKTPKTLELTMRNPRNVTTYTAYSALHQPPTRALPQTPIEEFKSAPLDWDTPKYVPGPIRIQQGFGPNVVPIMAAMDVLPDAHSFLEDQNLDDLVDFCGSYNFEPIVTSLDKFWLRTFDIPPYIPDDNRAKQRQASEDSSDSIPTYHNFLEKASTKPQLPIQIHVESPFLGRSPDCSSPLTSPSINSESASNYRFSSALSFLRGTRPRRGSGDSGSVNDASSTRSAPIPQSSFESFGGIDHAEASSHHQQKHKQQHRSHLDAGESSELPLSGPRSLVGGLRRPPISNTFAASQHLQQPLNRRFPESRTLAQARSLLGAFAGTRPLPNTGAAGSGGAHQPDWPPRHSTPQNHVGNSGGFALKKAISREAHKRVDDESSQKRTNADSQGESEGFRNRGKSSPLKKMLGKADFSGLGAYDAYYS